MAGKEEEKKGLQKSYSFDNVSFAAGDLTCDAKDVGEVQKHMAKLQGELANDMAKFTADDLSHVVKKAGPRVMTESGATEAIGKLFADPKTLENAIIITESLTRVVGSAVEPIVVPFLPQILQAFAHKKAEVRALAEEAGPAIVSILCAWAIRPVQQILFDGIKETKWQIKMWSLALLGQLAEKHPFAFSKTLAVAIPVIAEAMWDTKAQVKSADRKSVV